MDKVKVDIHEIISRLEQPQRDQIDIFAVSDAIDVLEYIDDTYIAEKAFLAAKLKESNDDETLNFIICVLRIINHSIDKEIIDILGAKIEMSLKQKKLFPLAVEYIIRYFSKQGKPFKDDITPCLVQLVKRSSKLSVAGNIDRLYSLFILWKWYGIRKTLSLVMARTNEVNLNENRK